MMFPLRQKSRALILSLYIFTLLPLPQIVMGGCVSSRPKHPSNTSVIPPSNPALQDTNSSNAIKDTGSHTPFPETMGNRFVNGAYYPNWRAYEDQYPSSFDHSDLTHVFYAFAGIDDDGTVFMNDERIDYQLPIDGTHGCLRAWTQLKQEDPELKVLVSIGGATAAASQFAIVAADPIKLNKFATSARLLVDDFALDGIDIDWEHPQSNKEGELYLSLLTSLRSALPSPQFLLTTALHSAHWVLQYIPLSSVAEQVDFINLMAYDFVGATFANVEVTGHHAQLHTPSDALSPNARLSGHSSVEYLTSQNVPSSKIVLGIPTYGRSFLDATGLNQPFSGAGGIDGIFEVRHLPRPGTEEVYDVTLGAVSCVGGDGGFVTYDNANSVVAKAEFCRTRNLAGLFYWHIGFDRTGENSLIAAGKKSLSS